MAPDELALLLKERGGDVRLDALQAYLISKRGLTPAAATTAIRAASRVGAISVTRDPNYRWVVNPS